MRSTWRGHISFGLDLAPISYERVSEADGSEVPWEDVVRGYEYEKGKFVVLTDEDFQAGRRRGRLMGGPSALVAALLLALVAGSCKEQEDPGARREVREATITAEVHSRLLAVEALRALPLAVETRGATVRVSGTVHDSTQAGVIRTIAGTVKGVEEVRLDLREVPPPDTTPAKPAKRRARPEPVAPAEPLPSLEEAG